MIRPYYGPIAANEFAGMIRPYFTSNFILHASYFIYGILTLIFLVDYRTVVVSTVNA